ncbi:MAG: flagellar basal body rod protein FlgB [Vampirovibrionales bacterium]
MMTHSLFSSFTKNLLGEALKGHEARQQALIGNLANVDTPHYKPLDVPFEGHLKAMLNQYQQEGQAPSFLSRSKHPSPHHLQRTHAKHFPLMEEASEANDTGMTMSPEAFQTTWRNDANGVDIESETMLQTQNAQKYLALSKIDKQLTARFRAVLNSNQ